MRILFLVILMIPLIVKSQQTNLSGIWKLRNAESVSGAYYEDGVPRIIQVKQEAGSIQITITRASAKADTSIVEILNTGAKQLNESITASNRKKTVTFNWNDTDKEWIKETAFTSKTDIAKIEISTLESFRIAPAGDKLDYLIKHVSSDSVGRNTEWIMKGLYDLTTVEQLAADTTTGKGLEFISGLTWEEIVDKAKKENKLIFVDCYATWCGPCKEMDRRVYPLNKVGTLMNDKFISVKVQMDTSKNDNYSVKLTYPIARQFEEAYSIEALPTYLFFNSEGKIVHKEVGAFNSDEFLNVVRNVNGYPSPVVGMMIFKEEINPQLKAANEQGRAPDWDLMEKNISKKYSRQIADKQVVNAKVFWYRQQKQWQSFCKYLVQQINSMDNLENAGWLMLNSAAYDIFEHSFKKEELEAALQWSRQSVDNVKKDSSIAVGDLSGYIVALEDTYANLLYKLKRGNALQYYFDHVIKLIPDHPDYLSVYNKMKQGLPTWPGE